MLLIFGNNFHLWGNSPVIKFRFVQNETYMEMRPPDLIWWSENLLECQLPECNQDIEVRVANYDLIYGEGKILKIDSTGCDDTAAKIEKPPGTELQQITSSHLTLDYIPTDGMEESGLEFLIKVTLSIKSTSIFILAETAAGGEKIHVQDIGIVIKLWSKTSNRLLKEIFVTKEGQRFCRNAENMVLTSKIQLDRIPNPNESLIVMVSLRKESTGHYLIDPLTKLSITVQKPIILPDVEPECDQMQVETPTAADNNSFGAIFKSQALTEALKTCEITNTKISLLRSIAKCDDHGELEKWEQMLNESLHHLRAHRMELEKRSPREKPQHNYSIPSQITPVLSRTEISRFESASSSRASLAESKDEDEDDEDGFPAQEEEDDGKEKTIAVPQISMDPNQKQGLVYWKFFNPGTRTFLELSAGKLQIIGSRRIQMLIESAPSNSKFINAALYAQKNEGYEMIEFCGRCKENGIPNVFCVLPRRGREHDYPWITFRITCTSTAKHWKGSPFWIGAEFLLDPSQGNIIKVFSPPIHVQSKVKTKDLVERNHVANKFNLRISQEILKNSSAPNGLDNLFALTQQQNSAPQIQSVANS